MGLFVCYEQPSLFPRHPVNTVSIFFWDLRTSYHFFSYLCHSIGSQATPLAEIKRESGGNPGQFPLL